MSPFGGAAGMTGGTTSGGMGGAGRTGTGGSAGKGGTSTGGTGTAGKGGSTTGGTGGSAGKGGSSTGGTGGGSAGKGGTSTGGTGSGTTCSNPIEMTDGAAMEFGTTNAVCIRVTEQVDGWGCSNMTGRTVSVNGTAVTCGQMPLPARQQNAYYFSFTAGMYTYAALYYWP
jgi:hypothetical protein